MAKIGDRRIKYMALGILQQWPAWAKNLLWHGLNQKPFCDSGLNQKHWLFYLKLINLKPHAKLAQSEYTIVA